MGTQAAAGEAERNRWPPPGRSPRPELRSLLPPGYAGHTQETAPRHLVLPATISVPLIVKILDSASRPPQLLMGAHGAVWALDGECAPSYLEVWLAPPGAYRLLGLPMDRLNGQTVDLTGVFGPTGRRLAERLREAPTWPQRFALMDRFLLGRLDRGVQPSPEVGWAWRRLVATAGAVPIGRIANEVGWSHKHLITKSKRQVGLPPKTAARLVRFDRVWRRLDERRPLDWGQPARDAGYADQAHLIRDFHEFTGTTPTAFAARTSTPRPDGAREVNSLQDAAAAAAQPHGAASSMRGEMMSRRSGPFWDGVQGRAPLPRAAQTLGLQFVDVGAEAGTIELAFTASEVWTNPRGNVLGAFVAAMLYDTVGPALLATLEPDQFQTTLQFNVSFLRPARPGRLIGRGRVVHRVGDMVFLEASLLDPKRQVVATATATARVIPLSSARAAA